MADYSQGPIAGAPPSQIGHNNVNTMSSNPDNAFLSNTPPAYRPWLKFLIPIILVFTLGVIAMVGYAAHTFSDGSQGLGFNLFAGAWTLIVGAYFILAFWVMPRIHYRWIIFILSVLSCIWWLAAFAYLASNTRELYRAIDFINQYSSLPSSYGFDLSDYGFKKRDLGALTAGVLEKRQYSSLARYYDLLSRFKTAAAVLAGASAVGAIIWVIFCVFTAFYAMALFSTSSSTSAAPPVVAPTMAGQEPKTDIFAHVQPTYPPQVATGTNTGFTPVRPDNTYSAAPTYNTVDHRDPRMAPGAEFLTPPPPGAGYVNPQFEADRNYTVSPLSIVEMPASQPSNLAEMPTAQR